MRTTQPQAATALLFCVVGQNMSVVNFDWSFMNGCLVSMTKCLSQGCLYGALLLRGLKSFEVACMMLFTRWKDGNSAG